MSGRLRQAPASTGGGKLQPRATLRDLGLKPHYLGEELVRSMLSTIERYKDRVVTRAIAPKTQWRPEELAGPTFVDPLDATPAG